MPAKRIIKGAKDMGNMFKEFKSAWDSREEDYHKFMGTTPKKKKKKK